MCAPVARNSRASAQDKNLRSASTSIPGPKHPVSRSVAGQDLSLSRSGPGMPRAGSPSPTSPPPATAPAGTPRHGPGWTAAEMRGIGFFVRHVRRRPVDQTRPGARSRTPRGHRPRRSARRPARTGTGPVPAELAAASRQRGDVRLPPPPPLSRVNPAARIHLLPVQQVTGAPLVIQPVGELGHHLPVPAFRARNSPTASTKYITSRAGRSRRRCSRAPAASTAASTSSAVKTLARTPTEIRSGSQPSGDSPSEPSCATRR